MASSTPQATHRPVPISNIPSRLLEDLDGVIKESLELGWNRPLSLPREPSSTAVVQAYHALLLEGWKPHQIERAMRAVGPAWAAEVSEVLPCLLISEPRSDLPALYASQTDSLSMGALRIVQQAGTESSRENVREENVPVQQERAPFPGQQETEHAAAAQTREAEREKQAAVKSWISRYVEQDSSSEASSASSSDVEDWELQGSVAERVAKQSAKRAQRAREALSPRARSELAARELEEALAGAAAAKESRDKALQREMGLKISQLRRELEALGMEEGADRALARAREGREKKGEGEGAEPDEVQLLVREPEAAEQVPSFSLFEESDAGPEEPLTAFDDRIPPPRLARAAPPLAAPARVSKKAPKASGAKQPPLPTEKDPCAVLQALCISKKWSAPKYERVRWTSSAEADDAASLAPSFSIYSVRVVAAERRANRWAQRPYVLVPPEAERWVSTPAPVTASEARSVAATFALCVLAPDEEALWRQVPTEPHRRLWFRWVYLGLDLEERGRDAERMERFALELLGGGGGGGGSGTRGIERADSPSGEEHSPTLAWDDLEEDAVEDADGELLATSPRANSPLSPAPVEEPLSPPSSSELDAALLASLQAWRASERARPLLAQTAALPVAAHRSEILRALAAHDVLVLSGETGSGKTTQVPQFLLDDCISSGRGSACRVVCTQPRRVAATSVALRVAEERGEDASSHRRVFLSASSHRRVSLPAPSSTPPLVSYAVRFESTETRSTRLLYCTTGVLLRRLARDPLLLSTSHVLLDEVHERSLECDVLLAVLRRLVARRRADSRAPPLKLVLMSATADVARLRAYLGDDVPAVAVAGRAHPVLPLFLEHAHLVAGYRLGPDSRAARRGAWDLEPEQALQGPAPNPEHDPARAAHLPAFVQRNLARLDEARIDYDLLEELVANAQVLERLAELNAERGAAGTGEEAEQARLELLAAAANESEHLDACGSRTAPSLPPPGVVLVFLPGVGEVESFAGRLATSLGRRAFVTPLHSRLPPDQQRRAFAPPPSGVRKVVVSTNVAETSVTIDGVSVVLDCARARQPRFDPGRQLSALVEDWVALDSLRQRRGRAGRVRPGVAVHLATSWRCEAGLARATAPEIARVSLESFVLSIHDLGLGPARQFAQLLPTPPKQAALDAAVAELVDLGCCVADGEAEDEKGATGESRGSTNATAPETPSTLYRQAPNRSPPPSHERLTPLGKRLATLPVHPRVGKLLVLGAAFRCVSPALSMAACLAHRAPWRAGGASDAAKEGSASGEKAALASLSPEHRQSDVLAALQAVEAWRAAGRQSPSAARACAARWGLDEQVLQTLSQLRAQLADLLAQVGGLQRPARASSDRHFHWLDDPAASWNARSRSAHLLRALLVAAASPCIAAGAPRGAGDLRPDWTDRAGPVAVHPSSVCHGVPLPRLGSPFLAYFDKLQTTRVFVRECSVVAPLAVLLLGGRCQLESHRGRAVVDGRLRLCVPPRAGALLWLLARCLPLLLDDRARLPARVRRSQDQTLDLLARLLELEPA